MNILEILVRVLQSVKHINKAILQEVQRVASTTSECSTIDIRAIVRDPNLHGLLREISGSAVTLTTHLASRVVAEALLRQVYLADVALSACRYETVSGRVLVTGEVRELPIQHGHVQDEERDETNRFVGGADIARVVDGVVHDEDLSL